MSRFSGLEWLKTDGKWLEIDGKGAFSSSKEVMDYDRFTADDLCGTCTLPVDELGDGWSGKVDLMRPKSAVNMISSADSDLRLALRPL